MSLNRKKKSPIGWVSISIIIHTGFVLALIASVPPEAFQLGTNPEMIELSTVDGAVPLGDSLEKNAVKESITVAKASATEESVKAPEEEVKVKKPKKKKTPKEIEPEPIVEEVAIAKNEKPPTVLPTKPEASESVEELPEIAAEDSVEVMEVEPVEDIEEPAEDVAKEEPTKEQLEEQPQEQPTEEIAKQEPLEEKQEDPTDDPELFAAETVEEEEKALAEAENLQEQAQSQESEKAESSALPALAETKESNNQKTLSTYGTSAGIRDIKEVRQVAGNIPPKYPLKARRKKQEGVTKLVYFVNPQGKVSEVRVAKSSGHAILDQEAVRAIAKYRFLPNQQGLTTQDVYFRLSGKAEVLPSLLRRTSMNQ